jgi:hypothetical protein
MSIKTQIGELFGRRKMKAESDALKRKPQVFNLADAKSIALIFDASDKDEFELIKKYVLYLREYKKAVKAIGYFSQKEIPELTYSKMDYDFFNSKELTWYQRPQNKYVENFIQEKYDVLIDLNIHNRFPLKYIAAISNAAFKVGKYDTDEQWMYDMMIQHDTKQGLKFLLRQVDTYLQMVNKREE